MRISDWSSDVCSSDLRGGKCSDTRPHIASHAQGTALDADQRVVLFVLQGVNAVIADHPADAPGIEHQSRQSEPTGNLAPPHQRRPTEHQRSEEHTSELQSLMRISYAVFCLNKKKIQTNI